MHESQLLGQALQVPEVGEERKNPVLQIVQAVAEVQVLQLAAQAWQDLTPEVTTSKKPAGQVPIQILGSAVVPAPFKNRVEGGRVVSRGLQEVQTVALEQEVQPGMRVLQSAHCPVVASGM